MLVIKKMAVRSRLFSMEFTMLGLVGDDSAAERRMSAVGCDLIVLCRLGIEKVKSWARVNKQSKAGRVWSSLRSKKLDSFIHFLSL